MNNNLEYKKIRSVKRIAKKQKVYNFNVPDYESYVANGFVVHNCENERISQSEPHIGHSIFSPEDIVRDAIDKHCASVCMTYNEPSISIEYLHDVANLCHQTDLKFIIKTNAYVNSEPWDAICSDVDAMNIDVKGIFSMFEKMTRSRYTSIYYKILAAVLKDVHVEVSIPIYAGEEMSGSLYHFCEEMKALKINVPCHLLKINPAYIMLNADTTSDEEIWVAKEILDSYFSHVYV